jgi:hypothetical protein
MKLHLPRPTAYFLICFTLLFQLTKAQSNSLFGTMAYHRQESPVLSIAEINSGKHAHAPVFEQLTQLAKDRLVRKLVLGFTKMGLPVEAYYFPGSSDKKALVIGGMHGSELSSIAIAKQLVQQLENRSQIYYHVLIIPSLFPDNALRAERQTMEIGSTKNIGRYSSDALPDPNRQMPTPGTSFDADQPFDYKNRLIEAENQWLLQTIQLFQPQRILNIHAIKDVTKAGVFADPRTNASGEALGFEEDSSLAITMATYIYGNNGCVPGNKLYAIPSALYHHDFPSVAKGQIQQRNLKGSMLPNGRGEGVSLGTWASTAVSSEPFSRDAIRILTMEFPGCKRPIDYKDPFLTRWCQEELDRFTNSISHIFLQQLNEEQ